MTWQSVVISIMAGVLIGLLVAAVYVLNDRHQSRCIYSEGKYLCLRSTLTLS